MNQGTPPMTFLPRSRGRPMVNVAPLIDVVFLLLIFFMVTTTFKTHPGLTVDLPVAPKAGAVRTDSLALIINDKGEFYLQGRRVPAAGLRSALLRQLEQTGPQPLVIEVDREIPARRLVTAMDTAQDVGFSRIVLPTFPGNAEIPAESP